jgi:hypothetical protein
MSKINYTILRNELVRDPIELGYHGKTPEEIVKLINQKQFSESAMFDESGKQIFYAVTKTTAPPVIMQLNMTKMMSQQIKRSRAELLFGPTTQITVDDIDLAR